MDPKAGSFATDSLMFEIVKSTEEIPNMSTSSIEVPPSGYTPQSSIVASTHDKQSLDHMLKQVSLVCWDPQTGLVVSGLTQYLSATDVLSALVFPEKPDISSHQGGSVGLDMSERPPEDATSLRITLDGREIELLPSFPEEARFLKGLKYFEEQTISRTKTRRPEFPLFCPIDSHQQSWSGCLTQTAKRNVETAWRSIKACLPEWPENDQKFGRWGEMRYMAPEEIAARQFAMIASLGIMVVSGTHPFPQDTNLAQGLGALANAIEVGRYHKRIILGGYAEKIRAIVAESVPGTAL